MKTNLLKKALALVLSIMVVLTAFGGALSVFAEDVTEPEVVTDPYGTAEDGIYTNGNDVFDTIDPVIGAKNLDFAEGLRYWSSKEDMNGAASYVLKKYTIDGVTAYGFKTEWLGSQWDGVATVRMQLDGVKAGETVIIAVEYMIDDRFTTTLNKFTYEKDGETVNAAANGHGIALYQFEEGSATTTTTKIEWGNQFVNNTSVHGTWITEACCGTTAAYDNPIVAICIQDTRSEAVKEGHATVLTNADGTVDSPVYFKSLKLLKANADGSYTDLQSGEPVTKYGTPLYGTEEDGIYGIYYKETLKHYDTTGNQWSTNALYPVVEGLKNGDFSEGFKYWGFRYADTAKGYTKLSDVFEITADGTLKYTGASRDDGTASPTYAGPVKSRFTLPGVKKGDVLKLFLDAKNGGAEKSAFAITLMEINGNAASTGMDNTYTNAEGATVSYDKADISLNINAGTDWALKTSDTLVVTNDNPIFRITSQVGSAAGGIEIDNIRVVKQNADGYTYTDMVSGELVYADGKLVGGTYEDGWSYSHNGEAMAYIGPFADLMNGDFTNGLKYWGSRALGAGSDYADVLLDGTNAYINLNNGGNADAQYVGIRSAMFNLPVKAGDKLALMYNYRNGDPTKYESVISVRNNLSTDTTWVPMKNKAATVMEAATDTTWGTAVNKNYFTVGTEISEWTNLNYAKLSPTINDAPAFFIELANNTKGVTMDIDNVQVVKYINAYTYETFDGEIIKFDPEWAGTFADGVTTATGDHSQMNNYLNAEHYVVNGDFEKGLKYWGCAGTIGTTAYGSTHVDLVTENGNSYIKFDGTTQTYYRGVKSGALSIPAAKLAIGDGVVIKFDVYDPNGDAKNVQIRFDSRYGNGASSNSTVNNCTLIEDKGNGWKTYITKVGSAITTASTANASQAVAAGDWVFYVFIQVCSNTASTAGIDNVELVKVIDNYSVQTLDDDTIIEWDPTWAGTFADGVETATGDTNQMNNKLNKDYYVVNGDFSEGLKFWGADGTLGSTCYGSTYMDLVTDGNNNYIKFDGVTRTYFNGFKSGRIMVPAAQLAIYDQVGLVFDVYDPDNSGNFQLRLDGTYGNGVSAVTAIQNATQISDKGNGWKTYVGKFATISAASTATASDALAAGDWCFFIAGQAVGNSASTAALDNIKIVKKVTDYSVIDLATGTTITWTPAWIGTFNDGISAPANNINNYYNTEYGVVNGDFSEGLKYWGVQGPGSLASDNADLMADGDNYYVQLDGVARPNYSGFRSANISIPAADLMVGDYVALKFDLYVPDGSEKNVQIVLVGQNMQDATATGYVPEIRLSICNLAQCKVIADKGNGWKTVVTTFNKNILKDSTATKTVKAGDWQFVIVVEVVASQYEYVLDEEGKPTNVIATDEEGNPIWKTVSTSKAAFDNFEIVRADRGGFGANAVAVDLEGNAIEEVLAGDANRDGKVDLVDLVRTKKYLANQASGTAMTSPISIASVAADASAGISANDIAAIINKILGI